MSNLDLHYWRRRILAEDLQRHKSALKQLAGTTASQVEAAVTDVWLSHFFEMRSDRREQLEGSHFLGNDPCVSAWN